MAGDRGGSFWAAVGAIAGAVAALMAVLTYLSSQPTKRGVENAASLEPAAKAAPVDAHAGRTSSPEDSVPGPATAASEETIAPPASVHGEGGMNDRPSDAAGSPPQVEAKAEHRPARARTIEFSEQPTR
jgi:hypothetical protein